MVAIAAVQSSLNVTSDSDMLGLGLEAENGAQEKASEQLEQPRQENVCTASSESEQTSIQGAAYCDPAKKLADTIPRYDGKHRSSLSLLNVMSAVDPHRRLSKDIDHVFRDSDRSHTDVHVGDPISRNEYAAQGHQTLHTAASNRFRPSIDIVIPWRLLGPAYLEHRPSRRSTKKSNATQEGTEETFEIRRIAQEQGTLAGSALARSLGEGRTQGIRERHNVSCAPPGDGSRAGYLDEESPLTERMNPILLATGSTEPSNDDRLIWDNSNPFASSSGTAEATGEATGETPHHRSSHKRRSQPTIPPRLSSRGLSATSHADQAGPTARRGTMAERAVAAIQNATGGVKDAMRRTSMYDMYEKAKIRGLQLQRKRWVQLVFEWTFYLVLVAFIYFVLIGLPLWYGAVYWLYWVVDHKFVVPGTWAVALGLAGLYAFAPLCILFEKDPQPGDRPENEKDVEQQGQSNTALLIPCYKSAKIVGPTLEAALKVFPPSHIFVIANGNSPVPLDDTEQVCDNYGVNHIWSPVGSKIVAQFVGCYAAKQFENVLLIDDDCSLPPNFPIVSKRLRGKVKCVGYTIKSVGPGSSRGTYCQQAQDMEYKLSGLQRAFAGKLGSCTFPHGAISMWKTDFLISTFHQHPGFNISEDWFFGHAGRQLGSRIIMCTQVFIETATPDSVFFSSGGSRGGFGEMTVFKQRFTRWNFFFVNGMLYNLWYIVRYWRLGWWELGAKLFVFQEVYETFLYLLAPFYIPISFIVRPDFSCYLLAAGIVLYFINTLIFNEVHLRLKEERIGMKAAYIYYTGYKLILLPVNVISCYWSLYKYAGYFAKRHPKIVEDDKAVDVVLRLEETSPRSPAQGRRMTVTAIGSEMRHVPTTGERKLTIRTIGEELGSATPGRRMTATVYIEKNDIPGPTPQPSQVAVKTRTSHAPAIRYMPSIQTLRESRAAVTACPVVLGPVVRFAPDPVPISRGDSPVNGNHRDRNASDPKV